MNQKNPPSEITAQQIMDWMLEKAGPILEANTKYITLSCSVTKSKFGGTTVNFKCHDLSDMDHPNSQESETPEGAFAPVLERIKPSHAAARLREQAAKLNAKAASIELNSAS